MRLPPLNALRAFEAAARHGGFIGASDELCVTRGAISRHVKLLEENLGVPLFVRKPHGIELTEPGRRLLPVLTDAFQSIARSAQKISFEKTDLRIICPPTISIRWLIPRLDQFRALHPDIRIRLTTEFYGPTGFDDGEYDLGFSVENDPERPPGLEVLPLFPMIIVPACAPQLLTESIPLEKPEDLTNFTLLHESADRNDWKSWLTAFGIKSIDPQTGDVFPNLDMAVKAAIMGMGVVMGDLVLTREEFETGALVTPFDDLRCETEWGRFCLIGSPDKWGDPNVKAFRSWASNVVANEASEWAL